MGGNMRKFSKPHEEKVAELLKFVYDKSYAVNNSGAPSFKAGDVTFDKGLLDCKTLAKPQKQQTIKKEDLEKIRDEAFYKKKEIYGLVINFGNIKGKEYFVLDEDVFLNMLYAYKEMKDKE